MDWNWFFSSLAQSVAALVGVVGAFLISSLLNNQASYARSRSRTRELLRESERLTDAAVSRGFREYNERTLEYALEEIEDSMREGTDFSSAEECYQRLHFPEYLPKEESLRAIERALPDARSRLAEEGTRPHSYLDSLAGVRLENPVRRQMYEQEREAIRQLVVEIKSHIRAVEEHLQVIQRNPESSRVVRVVLGAVLLLFWFGVIYPLSFMPVPTAGLGPISVGAFFDVLFSLRGLLLTLAFLLFTGLVLYLGLTNERLKHPVEEVDALRARLSPGSYSEYLRVRIENGIPL